MNLNKVQGVSFPRSGHHLLAHCLNQYFGDKFGYCSDVFRSQQFQDPRIIYQKNHDFDLNLSIDPEMKYLIQYRHPLESLISWYKWEVNNGISAELNYGWRCAVNRNVPLWNLYTHRNTIKRWNQFRKKRTSFWAKFVQKWILNNNHVSTCYVRYSDLVYDSFNTISRVILFFDPKCELNERKLQNIIAKNNIQPRSDITKFEFYNPEVYLSIEQKLTDEIKAANIQPLF